MRKAVDRKRQEVHEADERRRRQQESLAEAYRDKKKAQVAEQRERRRQNLANLEEQRQRTVRALERKQRPLTVEHSIDTVGSIDGMEAMPSRLSTVSTAAAAAGFIEEGDPEHQRRLERYGHKLRNTLITSANSGHEQRSRRRDGEKQLVPSPCDAEALEAGAPGAEAAPALPPPNRRRALLFDMHRRSTRKKDDPRCSASALKARTVAEEAGQNTAKARADPSPLCLPIKRHVRRVQQKLLRTAEVSHYQPAMRKQFRRILEVVEAVPDPATGVFPKCHNKSIARTRI